MSGASVKPNVARSGTALLLVDFLNDFRFPGGKDLVPAAIPAARRAAKLKARAAATGAAAIYVNDNLGDWKSDWRKLYWRCARPGMPGAAVARSVKPRQQDYFLFKPRHSAFYGTALEPLLEELQVRKLIITGLTADMCVLFTANDAYVRKFALAVPADCTAGLTPRAHSAAIAYFKTVLGADIRPSAEVRWLRARQ